MNKNYISYIFNIILVGIIAYLLFFNNKPTVDIKEYTDKIDSLSIVIETNNKKLDSLSNLENQQETNIKSRQLTTEEKTKEIMNEFDKTFGNI